MYKHPMISILIPIYNGIEFIEESVGSVLTQTFGNWELIIGVNGHEKNSDVYKTAKLQEEKSNKIRVFDFYEINGKANTLNVMIKYCNGRYVALLDVDDIWVKDKLMKQAPYVNIYDVIGSQCVYFGHREGTIPSIPLDDIGELDFRKANPIINSSAIIRKDLCHWNENGIEDYDLWLRLREQNKRFYNYPEVLVMHRLHDKSAFNSKGHEKQLERLFA
jgi:teichuronic acid biosynthesis glycosyltransferase TuaG